MAFPLRLTADLALGLAVRALGAKRNYPVVFNFTADENSRVSAASIGSPIVWIGGAEPLEQREIPSIANGLAAAGRYVFLQTNGLLLRRRIHELQPLPRLFLTICFNGTEPDHDTREGQVGAFRSALEGIRTARLSGFYICAQMMLHADRNVADLAQIRAQLRKMDLDGFLISPASHAAHVQDAVASVRRQLLDYRWALLSRLLDSAILPAPASVRQPSPALAKAPSPSEESAQI